MLEQLTSMRNEVLEIAETLRDEMAAKKQTQPALSGLPDSGIFRFRRYVIVVLVANRLLNLSRCSKSMVIRHKSSGNNGLLFYHSRKGIHVVCCIPFIIPFNSTLI